LKFIFARIDPSNPNLPNCPGGYTVEAQMANIGISYGKILSYDFLFDKTAKDYLIKKYYALRFEHALLKFTFIFYNTGNEWKIINFDYGQEFDEILK
jgi:hypothetical protein